MPRTRLSVSTGLSFLEGPLGSVDLAEAHENASNFAKKKDEMEKALFGVLYTMIRSSEGYNKIAVLRIILDFLQLLSFSVIGVPWGGAWTWAVSKSFGVLLVPSWFVAQYIVMYWLSAFFLIVGLVDAFFVWTQFKKSQFKFVFAIKMLRFFVSIMVTILYIPFLRVQLMVFSCSIVGEHMSCGGTTHIIYMVITCLVLALFLPLTIFLTVVYYDPDPASKYILAKPNGRTDLIYILLKTALCVASVAAPNNMWPVVITTMITSLTMYLITMVFLPYYRQSINNLLCGLFLVNFWISLGSIVSGARTETLLFTIIIFCVVPVVFGVGFQSAQIRNWFITRTIKEFSATPNINSKESPHTWRFPASIEINMRFVRSNPSSENIQKAQNILNQGLLEYPKSCFLHMIYANLCFSYLNNLRMAFVFLDRMRHLDPPVDIRFYIYRKDTEMKQKRQSESLGGDESLDLVNYIQFQNNFKSARRFHNKALRSIRSFWRLLLEDEVNIGDLPRAFKVIDTAEAKAKQYYVQLLDRYPKSIRILRAYGQFLEEVLQDTISADQYFARADVIEESKTSQTGSDGNAETKSETSEKSEGIDFITTHTKVGKRDFIIIIGKDSIIRDVNANCKIFGYKATDLLGKGIETVIPDPYKKNHSTYVMKHLTTGVTKIIGLGNRRLPILCKDGHLSAMTLSVTKVTVGNDFMFVGLVRKAKDGLVATDKDGKVIYSTDTIQFLFGWEDTDLRHKNIAMFVTGPHAPDGPEEPCFSYQKTDDGTGKIKPLAPGEVTVNIVNKAGASYQVTVQISLNFVDGIAVYTWWFLRKSEKEIDEDLESVVSHEPETNIPKHVEPDIDERKSEEVKSDFSFHRHARKGHLRMITRADSDWKIASAAKEYKRFALSRFSITIKWALLAILLLKVIGFVISIIGVETYNNHHEVYQSGQRTDLSQIISYVGRSIELDAFDDVVNKADRNKLDSSTTYFENLHKKLSYPGKKAEVTQLSVSLSSSTISAASELDIWSLGEYMISISDIILGSSIEQLKSSAVVDYVHFLVDNNTPIIEGFDTTIDTGRMNIKHQVNTYFWVEFGLLITSVIALGAVALLVFRPSLSKIHTERNKTLELFLKIPKSAIYSLSQGKPVIEDEAADMAREERNEITVTRSKIVPEHIIPFRESADLQSLPDALSVDSLDVLPNRVPLSKASSKEDVGTVMIKGPSFKASRVRTASTESRGPIPTATFKSALLRRLTYQYITVLAITAVALFPNVLTSHYLLVNGDALSLQNEYAAERMAYISRASLFIREIDITLNYNHSYPLMISSIDDAIENVLDSVETALERHESLESYQSTLTEAHLNLLYSDCLYLNVSKCNDPTDLNSQWASRGLNSLFVRYTDVVKLYVLSIQKNETFEYFDWMTSIYPSLHNGLNQSSVYYDEYITTISDEYRVIHILIFVGFVILLIIVYFVGFKSIVTRLNNEAKRTKAMILMIPESVAQEVEEIQAYLLATHDRDDEDDQF